MTVQSQQCERVDGALAARAKTAITKGLAFLAERQRPSGELQACLSRPIAPEPAHDPSIFATALIARSLVGIGEARDLRQRACDFIESHRERFGVWRHWTRGHAQFHYVPPDIDDTAVACIALHANGRDVPANTDLLFASRDRESGLFFSWISWRLRWVSSFAYWWISLTHLLRHPFRSTAFYLVTPAARQDIDGVVNANALFYLGRSAQTEPVVGFLLRVLGEHRETVCDKWYDDPFVVWYFFSRALRHSDIDGGTLVLDRLRSAAPQNALDRALALCVEQDWGAPPEDSSIATLLDLQQASGGWPLAFFYKGGRTRWGSEELTTGFCLEALDRWLRGVDS
jgi:hypothetical protein